jgi:pyruvate dehydrogenase E2 component (dihydrolipoamide acetyltransferase)
MSTDICLPRVSPDDAAVTLIKWHVAVGSRITPGDVLAEIESDKAVVELEAEDAGIITEIRVPEGSDDVHADQVLAVLDEAASDGEEVLAQLPTAVDPSVPMETPAPGVDSIPGDAPVAALQQAQADPGNGASPLAARMARQAGISLQSITGSGHDGRVLADDIRAAAGPAPGVLTARHERLAQSKREAPHFYMSLDCGADALMDFRQSLTDSGAQVSLNDLILKVTATTLKDVPALNSAWSDAGIRRFRSVDLAVAVAIEGGLITPVIRGADKKRIAEIADEMRDLVNRARTGQLSREEYQGGTFTVSNMGMYGVDHFTAVINPPQAAILAVGTASERPVVQNGIVTSANMMTCSLSVDHRVTDGVAAAEFLQTFKRLAEDPRLLLL